MLDYYFRLEVAELQGDLLKASRKGDAKKLALAHGARAKLIAGRE